MSPFNSNMPLLDLSTWSPFRIDALGLVTLIGADEVSKAVGRLVDSRYTKFLPVLGAYLIAGNQFTTMSSGYTIYNVSDAITTTCISGWLSRWLSAQKFTMSTTVIEWTVFQTRRRRQWRKNVIAGACGILSMSGLLVIAILSTDGFGIANAVSMVFSVLVRWYLIRENMEGLDQAVVEACHGPRADYFDQRVKLLVNLADGKLATMYAPRGLVTEGFTKRPLPPHKLMYKLASGFGWLTFGIHVISLGQSFLVSQLCTVVLLVFSTWATIHGLGSDEEQIAHHITATKVETSIAPVDRRLCAYVRLEPSEIEEESLSDWGLLPRKANVKWWSEYYQFKEDWEQQKKSLLADRKIHRPFGVV